MPTGPTPRRQRNYGSDLTLANPVGFQYNRYHAKARLSAEEEKESTKARVPHADGYPRRSQGAQTQKAYGQEETHRLIMLPKEHRLPSPQIKSVMRRGKRVHEAGLTLFYQKLDPRLRGDDVGEVSRFAVIVPKAVNKRAVGRNRLKRLTRESVRLALGSLAPGWDGVFMVRKGLGDDFASVNACVRDLLTRSKILS